MKQAWICLTRVPEPGRTKTRLLPVLAAEECAALHTAFLKDMAMLAGQVEADFFVAYTSSGPWDVLKEIFPMAKEFFPQEGADLGLRMHNAMKKVLSLGYEKCILTGSDLPRMRADHVESGFRTLDEADAAIGPTADGGYYLVGLKRPCLALFEKQTYGHSSVFDATMAAAERAGCSVVKALPCSDKATHELENAFLPFLAGEWENIPGVQCCGLGGCAAGKEPELSQGFRDKVKEQQLGNVYTYCASCAGCLRRSGVENVHHVLVDILGTGEESVLSMASLWNRAKRMF